MRLLVFLTLFVFYVPVKAQSELNIHPDLVPLLDPALAPFYHGVASGDPTDHSVIIWTKVTLPKNIQDAMVSFEFDSEPSFTDPEKKGIVETDANSDFTIKVDIGELKSGTKYYYRFMYNDHISIVGETKTLPSDPNDFSIAFAACSNYEWGYFNNYRLMAMDTSIDLVVHLGDYIYEYAPNKYGDTTIGRINVPDHEITSLDDYRTRYSLYRLDKDLRLLHQLKPFITTWDDHEIANNGYVEGAQNHQANEGNWETRKQAGKKTYYEWMPIRDNSYHELYRSFEVGKLFSLIILDTRIAGRSKQVGSVNDPMYNDPDRTILGRDQYDWLIGKMENKKTTWKLIGNQVPFGHLAQPDFKGGADLYMDGWDGYPVERRKFLDFIKTRKIKNTVFLTGDYHCSFALDNDIPGNDDPKDNVAVEFVVTSITSANDDESMPRDEAIAFQKDYIKFNPNLRYLNTVDHGYLVIQVQPAKLIGRFYYVDTVRKPSTNGRLEATYTVFKNIPVLVGDK
jgi:alkaline phosphatase D